MNTLEFCQKYLENYTINPDGTIDVDGDVYLDNDMEKLPVKFGKVSGYFYCDGNNLTTLEGCPKYIGGVFSCGGNKLTTLEGAPKYIGGVFSCGGNKLTTLEGAPNYVGGYFYCSSNKLTTLKGIEKCEILGIFSCYDNNIPAENYKYILTAKIGGEIFTGYEAIDKILNTYKNEVKYLHKALSELKKVNYDI
jgi:hypothetical protein